MELLRLRPRRRQRRVALRVATVLLVLVGLAYAGLVQLNLLPSLRRLAPAPFPPPATTRDGRWQQDVAYLAAQLPSLHANAFFQQSAEAFHAQAAALEAEVPTSSDIEIMLGMAALAATLGDGHTAVRLADSDRLHTLPLRLVWFGDDLVVVGAAPTYQ